MELNLKRPIVFFDLETTGINTSSDRIVEISAVKLTPDGRRLTYMSRVNPEIPIPASATQVHHISDADVANEPHFADIAPDLLEFFKDSDLAGFNSNKFDIPLLEEEFNRVGLRFDSINRHKVDVQNIFHKMEQRTLVAAYRFYCGKELEGAHSAMADTMATVEVLEAQLDRYADTLKNDVDALAEFSTPSRNLDMQARIVKNADGVPVFNFGKHKGKPVDEIFQREPSYYNWMMQGEFAPDTKDVLRKLHHDYNIRRLKANFEK